MIELYLMSWVIFSIEWLWSESPIGDEDLYIHNYRDYLVITLLLPIALLVIMVITIYENFERE